MKVSLLASSPIYSTLTIFYYLEELSFVHKSGDLPWHFLVLILCQEVLNRVRSICFLKVPIIHTFPSRENDPLSKLFIYFLRQFPLQCITSSLVPTNPIDLALVRYNWHIINYACSKYVIRWVLSYMHLGSHHKTADISVIPPKTIHYLSLPLPCSQALIRFLSLQISLYCL